MCPTADPANGYDALIVVSFGGPEGPDDVLPFLTNVTRGRNVTVTRLEVVMKQYERFGGVSPINQQNRDLVAALQRELSMPVYWGNRNWHPFLADTVRSMADDGVRRAIAFVTSPYSSYSSCTQYVENIEQARASVGAGAPVIDKLGPFFDHPGFIGPMVRNTAAALADVPADAPLVFTAHSIPVSMAASCDYEAQLRGAAQQVLLGLGPGAARRRWDVVYQSRSGPPSVSWLEPDISDHLRALRAAGADAAVVVPIGFVSDHMEVKYDLDVLAAATAADLGMTMVRAATVGTAPEFVAMIRDFALSPRPPLCAGDCSR